MSGRRRTEDLPYLQRSSDLCAAILDARKKAKFTRNELAARSGVNASTIQKIEDRKSANPGIFTVAALAVALDLDVTDLLRKRTGPLKPAKLSASEPRTEA